MIKPGTFRTLFGILIISKISDNQKASENQIRCDIEKEQLCDVKTCSVYNFPNNTINMDVSCFLSETIPKSILTVDIYYKRNDKYVKVLPTVRANICDLLNGGKSNAIIRKMFSVAKEHLNFKSCPLKGLLQVKDGMDAPSTMPPIFPAGTVKLVARVIDPNQNRTIIVVEYRKSISKKWNN